MVDAMEKFVQTQDFMDICKNEYDNRIKAYLMNRMWFKLVDALELFMPSDNIEEDYLMQDDFFQPKVNYYIPPRHNILKRPDAEDPEKDDIGLRYATRRVSPHLLEDGL